MGIQIKMKKIKMITILFVCFTFSNSFSETNEYNGKCGLAISMDEFIKCLDNELQLYDKKLNSIYRDLMKSNNKTLKISEINWVKFKETDCDFIASTVNEGLYYIPVYKVCLINKTKSRIIDLQRSFFYSDWFGKN